jgi:hypothetical protein
LLTCPAFITPARQLSHPPRWAGAFGLRPLYCPWPCCFRSFPGEFSAACTVPGCALRGVAGGETMTTPGGTSTISRTACCNILHVLGAPASIIGSEFPQSTFLRSFAVASLSPVPMP